ncbi:MAG: hypothetical protein EOP45_00100 [Sphingobacteriaceae bacterium]|nr:MAG: hypothetical protein EOP45_00100 [Sphingobacteriaceae bacterium]
MSDQKRLPISRKMHELRDCYKILRKQNRAGADIIWGSVVPPLFVPISKGGHLGALQTAIIGQKNPAHLVSKYISQL